MKKNTLEMLGMAGLVASLVITTAGCTPVRRGSANLRDKTPENDRVLPGALEGEAAGEVVEATKEDAKALPYWKLKEQGLVDDVATSVKTTKTAVPAGYTAYTVKKGESLSKIAYRYGLRWQDVAAANPGLNPNKLKEGQVISLPGTVDTSKAVARPASSSKKTAAATPAGANVYTVQSGDYIGKIAGKFHVRSADIKAANNLKSDKIIVGQKLVIPAKGVAVSTQPAKSAGAPVSVKAAGPKPVTPVTTAPAVVATHAVPAVLPDPVVEPAADPMVVPADLPSVDIPAPVALPDVLSTPAPAPVNTGLTHTVGDKEDLFSIAIRWGVSANEIMKANNLTSEKVAPGTVLVIPAAK